MHVVMCPEGMRKWTCCSFFLFDHQPTAGCLPRNTWCPHSWPLAVEAFNSHEIIKTAWRSSTLQHKPYGLMVSSDMTEWISVSGLYLRQKRPGSRWPSRKAFITRRFSSPLLQKSQYTFRKNCCHHCIMKTSLITLHYLHMSVSTVSQNPLSRR